MRKKFVPPTLEQVTAYVKENNLAVDPQWFVDYFTAGEWHDKTGAPVKNWKQKLWTHHRHNLERGGHKCYRYGCRKHGVYIVGKDRDGHVLYACIDHKPPPPKPVLPSEMLNSVFKHGTTQRVNFDESRTRNLTLINTIQKMDKKHDRKNGL